MESEDQIRTITPGPEFAVAPPIVVPPTITVAPATGAATMLVMVAVAGVGNMGRLGSRQEMMLMCPE